MAASRSLSYTTFPTIPTLARIISHATPEQRARRKQTFFHQAITRRQSIGQGTP